MKFAKRVWAVLRNHPEPVVIAAMILFLRWAFVAVQHVDARIGFDGWSDSLYRLLNATVCVAVFYGAWVLKRAMLGETTVEQDAECRERIMRGETGPLKLLIYETVTYLVIVGIAAWAVLGKGH
jgi:hypothetical protein